MDDCGWYCCDFGVFAASTAIFIFHLAAGINKSCALLWCPASFLVIPMPEIRSTVDFRTMRIKTVTKNYILRNLKSLQSVNVELV